MKAYYEMFENDFSKKNLDNYDQYVFNQERLALLIDNNGEMCFAPAETSAQGEAKRHFECLTPAQRTELLGTIYSHYARWHNDQQRELVRMAG